MKSEMISITSPAYLCQIYERQRFLFYLILSASLLLCSILIAGCNGPQTKANPTLTGVAGGMPPATPKFVDITSQAGLGFKQYHGGCGLYYFVEQVAAGAAL